MSQRIDGLRIQATAAHRAHDHVATTLPPRRPRKLCAAVRLIGSRTLVLGGESQMQRSRQAINVAVVLMGLQDTSVAAHRPGTEGAAVSVRIGSALLYVADAETASRFTGAWRSVATAAERHLPRQGNPARATPMPGVAEPAVMVDAAGSPPAFARLERPAGQASHARVVLGRIMFDVRDLAAFRTTALAFEEVENLSASTFLPKPVQPAPKERAARTAGRFFVAPAKDSRRLRREAARSSSQVAPATSQAAKAIERGR